MEANFKLLKKKRIAHSHMSKSRIDAQKLPPDDFVYSIMKDMDSNDIISNHHQKIKTSKGHNFPSKDKLKNSENHDVFNNQERRVLPKKSAPLMKKCQTSLKYLEKNRCIPKPRAHLGSDSRRPTQPVRPVDAAGPSSSKCKNEKSVKSVKKTKVQSKAYSKVMESDLLKKKVIQSPPREDTFIAEVDNEFMSSSEEDDALFESFIRKNKKTEKKISSDSSDSHVIIHRKRSIGKTRNSKKKHSVSNDENKHKRPKVTSIPLSESSDSECEKTVVANDCVKRKLDSPTRVHKRARTGPVESCKSDSSIDPLPDFDTYNDSSCEDSVNEDVFDCSNFSETSLPSAGENFKTSTFDSVLATSTNNRQLGRNQSSVPDSLSIVANGSNAVKNNVHNIESNSIISNCDAPKAQVQCRVVVERDPNLDKTAATCSTINSSTDVCLTDTDEADNEETFKSLPSVPVVAGGTTSNLTVLNKDVDNQKYLHSVSSNLREDVDDCVFVCEVPNVGSNDVTLNSVSVKCSTESTSEDSSASKKLAVDGHLPPTSAEEEDTTLVSCESTTTDTEEFNVQIVAVESLFELSDNNAVEENEIEVIDLSDDEGNSQKIECEDKQSEVVKQLETTQHNEEGIQCEKESPLTSNDHNLDSQAPIPKPANIPDSKILDLLKNIDFDAIKNIDFDSIKEVKNPKEDSSGYSAESKPDSGITSPSVVSENTAMEAESKPNIAKLNEASKCMPIKMATTSVILNTESNPVELTSSRNDQQKEPNVLQQSDRAIAAGFDSQLNSDKQIKIKEPQVAVEKGNNPNAQLSVNVAKHKDELIIDTPIKKPKYEIFESPSEELDIIASSFAKDLGTPNKTVDALLNLYKAEYARLMNIVNTEANVTQGLKMLHDKQLEKLIHLRSSIQNVVKRDPCYHTVIKEKYGGKAEVCIKNEAKSKDEILTPTGTSEKCYPSKADELVPGPGCSSNESGSEIARNPELEDELSSQSTVTAKTPLKTHTNVKFLKFGENPKCFECGKLAAAFCQRCAEAAYCSPECAFLYWKKVHKFTCKSSVKQVEKLNQ